MRNIPSCRLYTNFYTICAESYADLRRFRWILKIQDFRGKSRTACKYRDMCSYAEQRGPPVLAGHEGRHVLRDSRFFQKVIRKARLHLQVGLLFPAPCRERGKGRDISFSKRDIPPLHPPRENFHCKRVARRAAMLADCTAHSAALPRLKLLYDLPLLLSSAVAQPLAALLPYGCGTPLAGAALPIL